MTPNKAAIDRYMEAFRRLDHAAILECLTDDVEWFIPGAFRTRGKAEFDAQVENDAFVGKPDIEVTRLVEDGDVVVAEGAVRCTRRDGVVMNLVFCDVFLMRSAKIRHLTSYLMELK